VIPSYINGCIRDLEDLNEGVVTVNVIASALSKVNRFNGQTPYPYSVAQHSVLVSHLVTPRQALEGLFHDAAEAFIGDLSKWVKPLCPAFMELESKITERIEQAIGLYPDHSEIKRGDLLALRLEQMWIQGRTVFYDWEHVDMSSEIHGNYVSLIREMSWQEAFLAFMVRHAELTRHRT
jgi:hypothetical protein